MHHRRKIRTFWFRRSFGHPKSHTDDHHTSNQRQNITLEERVEILKALADETRLSIVQKLVHESDKVPSCDILSCPSVHKLSQPAMSHHFGKLVDAGVIIETKQGTQKLYELNCALLTSAGINITSLN